MIMPQNWLQKASQSDYVFSRAGEWFIDDYGHASYCDGDLCEDNHETVALKSMIPDEYWDDYINKSLTPEQVIELGPEFTNFMNSGCQAREWMVTERNWIRVHGDHFEVGTLDAGAIGRIDDFIGERLFEFDMSEDYDEEIYIDELNTNMFRRLTIQQVSAAVRDPGAMTRLLLRRTASGYNGP